MCKSNAMHRSDTESREEETRLFNSNPPCEECNYKVQERGHVAKAYYIQSKLDDCKCTYKGRTNSDIQLISTMATTPSSTRKENPDKDDKLWMYRDKDDMCIYDLHM